MNAAVRCIALAAAAVLAFHTCPATAKEKAQFVFTALAPPGSTGVNVFLTGIHQDQVVGDYLAENGTYQSFVWSAGKYGAVPGLDKIDVISDSGVVAGNTPGSATSYSTYDLTSGATNKVDFGPPGGAGFTIGGINSEGTIAATQYTTRISKGGHTKTLCQPFEQDASGSYTWLGEASTSGLNSVGVTDDNVIVMDKECNKYRVNYFVNRSGKRSKYRIPGSEGSPGIQFVTGAGFGGDFYTVNEDVPGFTTTGKKSNLTIYPVPPKNSVGINVTAFGPHHEIAGYSVDASGYYHGFIYADTNYYFIDYPDQKSTIITGFSSTGAIIGYFGDLPDNYGPPSQPFIAKCGSEKGCKK
jgi:hypothetical protein